MSEKEENNKRIAKNTILLYFRTLVVMIVGLFTSRVNLNSLGIEDYGIYNVVAGLVVMFTSLTGALSMSTSRFLTFEMGRGDTDAMKRVYSTSVIIHLILSIGVVVLAQTVGLWFLNTKMVIDPDRINAANWVFQFSLISFIVNFLNIPHTASIVSHERMSVFAYFSIVDALVKVLIAYLTFISPWDKLVFFASLHAVASVILFLLYLVYCRRHFSECKFSLIYDRHTFRKMFAFSGWNFIGSTSYVLKDQGGNILINIFFGPTINASRGIAMQVNHAVYTFVTNFTAALNPQITKRYSSGEYNYVLDLVFKGARFSYYILLLLSVPILINTEYLINLWLGQVPDHTVAFLRLILLFSLNESLSIPLSTLMMATGKIKKYQLSVGLTQLMNIPVSYIALKLGSPVESVFIILLIISILCLFLRLYNIKKVFVLFSVKEFLIKVYCNVLVVSAASIMIPILIHCILPDSFVGFMLSCIICVLSTSIAILSLGCSASEKNKIIQVLKTKICINKK